MCTACYKSHLQILKEVPSSTDRDLIDGCTLGQHNIRSTEDVINTAMHHTTIYVGELLLQQILLPSVYGKFHTFLEDISHKYKIELQNDDTNKVTICICKKKNKKCGEGCNCLNCKNAEYTIQPHDDREVDLAEISIEEVIADDPPSDIGDYMPESENEVNSDSEYCS